MTSEDEKPQEAPSSKNLADKALSELRETVRRASVPWPDDVDESTWKSTDAYEPVLFRARRFLVEENYASLRTTVAVQQVNERCARVVQICQTFRQAVSGPLTAPEPLPEFEEPDSQDRGAVKNAKRERQALEQSHQKLVNQYQSWKDDIEKAHVRIGGEIEHLSAQLVAAGVHPWFEDAATVFERSSIALAKYDTLLRDLTLQKARDVLSSSFSVAAEKLESGAKTWQGVGIAMLVLTTVSAAIIGVWKDELGFDNLWFARLVVGSPLVAIAIYAFRQHSVSAHVARQYRYRQSLASVLAAFGEVISHADNAEHRAYLKDIVLMMFTPPSFSPGKTTVEQSLKAVQGLLDSAGKFGTAASKASAPTRRDED